MGAGVRVAGRGVDIIAAENWRCRWKKSRGVVVVVKCETVTAQTYVYQNKHGSFGRYDRRTSSAFPRPLCSWPQLYLLASALSIFSRLGWHSSLGGGFYIRLYILLAFPSHLCPVRYPFFLPLHYKFGIIPPPSCDNFLLSLTHARRDMNVHNQSHTCPAAVRAHQHVHAIIFLRWHTDRRWTHANFRGLRFCNGQQPAARPGEFRLSGSSSL